MRYALLFLLWAAPASAQILRVTTDKATYAHKEPIRLTVAVINRSAEALQFSLPSGGGPAGAAREFSLDGRAIGFTGPPVLERFQIPPRSRIEWGYVLSPEAGFLEQGERHLIRVRLDAFNVNGTPHVSWTDSTTFEAPPYVGGRFEVGYRSSDSTAAFRALTELQARRLTRRILEMPGRAPTFIEMWQVQGTLLDSVVAAAWRFGVFDWVDPARRLSGGMFQTVTGHGLREGAGSETLTAPAPNPFTTATTLVVRITRPGPMRIALFDALGRQTAVLFDGTALMGQSVDVKLRGDALPAGTYFVRVTTRDAVYVQGVVRASR
jgi:hypothetical protein